MTKKTQDAFNNAKSLYSRRQYQEAADYLYNNMDERERDEPNSIISFFEGECFEKLGEMQMACDCYKNAYLSTIQEYVEIAYNAGKQ